MRRKTMQYFTTTHYDKHYEKITKDAELAAKKVWKERNALLPMHPKIIEQMEDKRAEDQGI